MVHGINLFSEAIHEINCMHLRHIGTVLPKLLLSSYKVLGKGSIENRRIVTTLLFQL
jgi:hypothetical protein